MKLNPRGGGGRGDGEVGREGAIKEEAAEGKAGQAGREETTSGKAVEERMAREVTGKTTAGGKEEDTRTHQGGMAARLAALEAAQ